VILYGYSDNGTVDSVADFLTVKGPYATLKADKLFACGSDAITLSTVAHNAISYSWDFGDGTVLETRDTFAVHHYLTPGIYTPFLVLKDGSGCQFAPYQLAGKIVVDTLHISLNIPPVICKDADSRFSAEILSVAESQLQQALQYHWNFGTGNLADTSANKTVDFSYTRAGIYPVSLKVISPYGCMSEKQVDIPVLQAVKGRIAGPSAICQDDTVSFAAITDTMLTDLKWKWIFPNNAVSTKQEPDAQQFNVPGNDTVMLVIDNAGCSDTAFHIMEVHAKPGINITPAQPFVCMGDSIQLHVPAGPSYHWETSTYINNQDAANPFVFPPATASYVVKATNVFGCTNKDSIIVSVVQKFNLVTDDSVYICKGSNLQLKASGADKYLWIDGNDLSNPQIPNPVTNTTVPRSYTVVGFDKYGCFSDTAVTKVKVEQLPVIDAGPDITTQAGVEVQLNAVSGNDISAWHWQPSTYLSCSDCPSPKSTPRSEISYVVEAVTAHNCKARDTVNIHLLCKGSLLKIPTAFTPNGDMVNDYFRISGDGIKLIKHIVIFGRWGEKLFEKSNVSPNDRSAGWDGNYQGHPLPTGTYVYIGEIICSTGEIFTYKGTITLVR